MITHDSASIGKKLQKNVLFNLSLGSKELFHSNFLASIIGISDNNDKSFSKIFLKNLLNIELDGCSIEVSREQKHTDIIIRCYQNKDKNNEKGELSQTIIIENKVKSLPEKNQLDEYVNKFKDKDNPKFYLLSLMEPDFNIPDPWIELDYFKIEKALRISLAEPQIMLPSDSENITFKALILEYCDFVNSLTGISKILVLKTEDKYDFLDGDFAGIDFKDLRINDLLLKVKYQALKNHIFKKMYPGNDNILIGSLKEKINSKKENIIFRKNEIFFGSGLSNTKGFTDTKIYIGTLKYGNYSVPHFLCIQLQGRELRYASEMVVYPDTPKNIIEEIHKKVLDVLKQNWLMNAKIEDKYLKDPTKRSRGNGKGVDYNKFDSNFFYKYDVLNNNITINDIIHCFEVLIKYAKTIIPNIIFDSRIKYIEEN